MLILEIGDFKTYGKGLLLFILSMSMFVIRKYISAIPSRDFGLTVLQGIGTERRVVKISLKLCLFFGIKFKFI